jgi:hypothetical protein
MAKTYMGGGTGGGDSYTAGTGIDITGNVISATAGDATAPQTVKVSLSSAQIKFSNSSRVSLLPPPANGQLYVIQSVIVKYNYGTIDYDTNTSCQLVYSPSLSEAVSGIDISGSNGFTNIFVPQNNLPVYVDGEISFYTLSDNPENGDGTIDLWITYSVISL